MTNDTTAISLPEFISDAETRQLNTLRTRIAELSRTANNIIAMASETYNFRLGIDEVELPSGRIIRAGVSQQQKNAKEGDS